MKKGSSEKTQSLEQSGIDKKLLLFFVSSFKYSQGNDVLQRLFFTWAINSRLISETERNQFCRTPVSMLNQVFSIPTNHIQRSMIEVTTALETQLQEFQKIKIEPALDMSKVLLEILLTIADKDMYYLSFKLRPNRKILRKQRENEDDSISDSRASHLRKYVFTPENVKDPVFRVLFQELKFLFLQLLQNRRSISSDSAEHRLFDYLDVIERRWKVTHKGRDFYQPLR